MARLPAAPWGLRFMRGRFGGTRWARCGAVCALLLTCACVPAAFARQQSAASDSATQKPATATAKPSNHRTTTSSSSGSAKGASTTHTAFTAKRSRKKRVRGQQKIDSERARSIQEALIREHYLNGEPTGTWNQSSEEAMRRYQGDHGWQTKQVPDSRALIKLGLGPSNDHLLNPDSAMTTAPDAPRVASQKAPATEHAPAQAPAKNDPSQPQ
jgi:peptidoglycan hydrolase-like protein with peptidoglycan-binding domain